ncbi:MAG: RNA polymerase sigma factor [Planctomycetaceae bacterium]
MAATSAQAWVLEAVDRYERPLMRYARRLLDDCNLAADAVQHAFLRLCEQPREAVEGRVAPWLFRVCRNRAVDHMRKAGRERSLLDADHDAAAPSAGGALPGREADPALAVERADLARHLSVLLARLPAPQRETIDLWCEGLSHRQIAEITARSEAHVRVLAHRGLTALRRHPQVRALLADHGSHDDATTTPHPAARGTP